MTLFNALFAWLLSFNPMAPVSTSAACVVDATDLQPCSNEASTEEDAEEEDDSQVWVWGVRPWLDRNHGISNGI
jgi:hypothetical protein